MEHSPLQFFTASILNWRALLFNNEYKKIITDSLRYLVLNDRVRVYGFVIMPNHIHLIWQMKGEHLLRETQRDFLKFTSQQIQKDLRTSNPNLKDRRYQIWQRRPLSITLNSRLMIEQKLDYIHNNPVQGKWRLSSSPIDYRYSSALYYENGETEFDFLSHYMSYFE